MTTTAASPAVLPTDDAATYADWFACLAEPTRVRLLHAVATAARSMTVGELTELLGISQSTCSHHVRKLVEVGFLRQHKEGTATHISVNPSCCTGLPHAADVVMGVLAPRPCCPEDLPADVLVRPLESSDWTAVRRIYSEGIATGDATFETEVPLRRALDAKWLPEHRWIAEIDGQVAGWAALTAVSTRDCYAGVAETSVYAGKDFRGRGVGRALVRKQVNAADDAGLWTLQTSIFPENRTSLALHHSAGFRTLGVRERIAQHHGVWRDTVFLERRTAQRPAVLTSTASAAFGMQQTAEVPGEFARHVEQGTTGNHGEPPPLDLILANPVLPGAPRPHLTGSQQHQADHTAAHVTHPRRS